MMAVLAQELIRIAAITPLIDIACQIPMETIIFKLFTGEISAPKGANCGSSANPQNGCIFGWVMEAQITLSRRTFYIHR
jgi:hypothetical protein